MPGARISPESAVHELEGCPTGQSRSAANQRAPRGPAARAAPLLVAAAAAEEPAGCLQVVLPQALRAAECEQLSVMRRARALAAGCPGRQRQRAARVPVGASAGRERARGRRALGGRALADDDPGTGVLAMRCSRLAPNQLLGLADALAALLGRALSMVRQRHGHQRRVERLEAILQIAAQWNKTRNMGELLRQMAEASTQLFQAERASIFLWDRRNKMLVGRPALGISGGELRIPDDRGVVGQVIQSGEPRLVDVQSPHDQQAVYREVDQQLGYHTRSLLCVPLRGANGKLLGAFELINKRQSDFTAEDQAGLMELARHAATALENSQAYQQLLTSRQQIVDQAARDVQLIGISPVMEQLRSRIERVARTELAVLLLGENGTGKEVASRMLHYQSPRRNEPFIAVNCAALTESLLESELFGHERGAFTDAHEARAGKFELASGGTLFLDEIGDLSPGGQAKLLRVLEEKIVVRVGGSLPISTDVRVIAATNQNLAELVRENRFREDLFFRLNVVVLEIPPLRQRGEDILRLAEHFLHVFCTQAGRQPPQLTAAARHSLLQYAWPGNVRELRNLMERLAYLTQGDIVDADELVFVQSPRQARPEFVLDLPLADATSRFQIEYIRRHVEACQGNMTDAAQRLGLHRSNLYRKMHQLGIAAEGGPPPP